MSPEHRALAIRSLRMAADALERGEDHGDWFVYEPFDGYEWNDHPEGVENVVEGVLELDGEEEWPSGIENVCWGIVVPMRIVEVEVLPDDYHGPHTSPKAQGFDYFASMRLVDKYPESKE